MKKPFVALPKKLTRYFPINKKATLVDTGTKLGPNFNLKDITKKELKYDLGFSV